MKHKYFGQLKALRPKGIQSTLMWAFSLISISIMLFLGIVLYVRFSALSRQENVQNSRKLLEQTGENLEDYLVSMRQISDAVYYNVIKENEFSSQKQEIQRGMNLLYEAKREDLRSIAIYNSSGSLLAAEPVASQKEDPNVTRQDWFRQAMGRMENMHFSTPHIQNLFDDGTRRYYWVISLSRVVELTDQGDSQLGVLLVDMDYSNIFRMMNQVNTLNSGQYYYLCDSNGQIIYHPRQIQISQRIYSENSEAVAGYKDGAYDEIFEGERRKVLVSTISYTGWKLVSVIPYSTFAHGMVDVKYFIMIMILLMVIMLVLINRVVSLRISRPILELNHSIVKYEAGEKPEIYIGGSTEIRHLGYSVQKSYEQIDSLMQRILLEQAERRKSEFEALQSQINPHFLYNALESIIWMVEGERNEEAVFMISQLARLFRISLSKGRSVITVKEELQHAQSYMNIQKVRYKNAFTVIFDVDAALYSLCTVKLILQPILENAIHYGVGGMEDSGEIRVTGRLQGEDAILQVTDNGLGMSGEEVALVLKGNKRSPRHGSGVGLVNVNNRIQILFGREYGLTVTSEPDAGTSVIIRMPAVPYTEENREVLEKGQGFLRGAGNDKEAQGMKDEE